MVGSDSPAAKDREPVLFLVFSASVRSASLNGRLARLAAATIEANGGSVDFRLMADFDTPHTAPTFRRRTGSPLGPISCASAYRPMTPS